MGNIDTHFNTEEFCRNYIVKLRWPDGFQCRHCGHKKVWFIGATMFQCAKCGFRTSIIAGTIFQGTHKPLTMWFKVIWMVINQKDGTSANELKRLMGLKSYETAWSWLHKLRRAMNPVGEKLLSGKVELGHICLNKNIIFTLNRDKDELLFIAIAAELNGWGRIKRIVLKRIPTISSNNLINFTKNFVERESTLFVNKRCNYSELETEGYILSIYSKNIAGRYTPRIFHIKSLLKEWLKNIHHNVISRKYIDYYLDEFAFHFNYRNISKGNKLFNLFVNQAVKTEPYPYKNLIMHCKK
jgi:ribosomal protein L37AE/L43A